MRSPAPLAALCAALALAACQPPLSPSWRLTDFRVLGVRVRVEGTDRTLAQPARGERFALEVLTADVRARDVQTLWLVLPRAASPTEIATGGGSAASSGLSPSLLSTVLPLCLANMPLPVPSSVFQCGGGAMPTFVVPDSGGGPDSAGRESLTVLGYSCAGGTIAPAADASTGQLFQCTGADARGWQFARTVYVRGATETSPNHNPTITEVRLGLPPAELTPIAPGGAATVARCADQPVETARGSHSSCAPYRLAVGFAAGSREEFTQRNALTGVDEPLAELLTVRYLVERGTLAGASRTDSEGDPMSPMEDDYITPADPGPVTVYIYASDGRGGFDWTTRTLTVQ